MVARAAIDDHLDQAREGFHRSGTRRGLPELQHHRCLCAFLVTATK